MSRSELDTRIIDDICKDDIQKKMWEEYGIDGLVETSEYKLKEQIQRNPFHIQNFRLLALKEMGLKKVLEIERDEHIGNLYDTLKNKSDVSLTKAEIEKYYIPKDPEVIKYKKRILLREIRLEFFESIKDALEKQAWSFKNVLRMLE